jgi:predicted ATP-grasp superfamily ATP-dependent carboligase
VHAAVTDADVRSSVAAIRGLGRAGIRVVALGPAHAPGLSSRYASERMVAPDAAKDRDGFLAVLAAAATRWPGLAVYPGREESLDVLLGGGLTPNARLPYPRRDVVDVLRDKRTLPRLAERAGLRTPRTLHEGAVGALDQASVEYPCLIKPLAKGTALQAAHVLGDEGALSKLMAALPPDEGVIVQERVAGALEAVSLVLAPGGRLVARFQQRALATWPVDAGPSRLAVGLPPDEDLIARTASMLEEAGYWGLAHVQFLTGPDGPCLIDVNPRFYGSIALAMASGVNLPAVWHAVTVGDPSPSEIPRYMPGVTYRWVEGELLAALHGSPRSAVRRARAPRVGPMWAADDPLASAALASQALSAWLARRGRTLARGMGRGGRA